MGNLIQSNTSEQIAVVDSENRFLRWEGRQIVHENRLFHRSVYVLVFDPYGRMLVQQRHASKQTFPLHWDISVAGHVDVEDYKSEDMNQVYFSAARRELSEELGVIGSPIDIGHMTPEDLGGYEHVRIFSVQWDGSITFQASEIAACDWLSAGQLRTLLNNDQVLITPVLCYFAAIALEYDWVRDEKGII